MSCLVQVNNSAKYNFQLYPYNVTIENISTKRTKQVQLHRYVDQHLPATLTSVSFTNVNFRTSICPVKNEGTNASTKYLQVQSQHGRYCNFVTSRGEESEEFSKGRIKPGHSIIGPSTLINCASPYVGNLCSLFRQILWNESSVLDTRSRKVGQQ